MKAFLTFIILVAIVVGGYFILHQKDAPMPPTEETASDALPNGETTPDTSMNGTKEFDSAKSSAKWTGSKTLIKDYYDTGTIAIKSGNAIFANGVLTGGSVVFDMNSIATTSTGRGNDASTTSQQAKHMKSADFFDAATYPEASFVITSAAPESSGTYLVTGAMTIKGATNTISFPVEVTTANGVASISGTATLDRTLWNVKYGSEKFFKDLGDKVIGDEFTLAFTMVTK